MKKIKVLEGIRGFAAIYVFLGHFVLNHLLKKESDIGLFLRFGQEAVMVFFLLSGFVIYYSFHKYPHQTFGEYFRRRALRIYPIYFASLLISYGIVCQMAGRVVPFDVAQFAGNLFMLQDFSAGKPGVWFGTFYGNLALWSLSYEWWFYMLFFPIVRLVQPDTQKWLVGLLSLLGFISYVLLPNQVSLYLNYFLIWWVGVELAKTYSAGRKPSLAVMKVPVGLLGVLTSLHLLNTLYWWKVLRHPLSFGVYPILELRHFAFALAVVVIALLASSSIWRAFSKVITPFSCIAPISYALYVFHYPLAVSGTYLSPIHSQPLEMIGYVSIAFAAAYLAEFPMQRVANRLFRSRKQLLHSSTAS